MDVIDLSGYHLIARDFSLRASIPLFTRGGMLRWKGQWSGAGIFVIPDLGDDFVLCSERVSRALPFASKASSLVPLVNASRSAASLYTHKPTLAVFSPTRVCAPFHSSLSRQLNCSVSFFLFFSWNIFHECF